MGDGGIVLRKLRPHVAPLAVKSSALVVGFPARIQREEFVGGTPTNSPIVVPNAVSLLIQF